MPAVHVPTHIKTRAALEDRIDVCVFTTDSETRGNSHPVYLVNRRPLRAKPNSSYVDHMMNRLDPLAGIIGRCVWGLDRNPLIMYGDGVSVKYNPPFCSTLDDIPEDDLNKYSAMSSYFNEYVPMYAIYVPPSMACMFFRGCFTPLAYLLRARDAMDLNLRTRKLNSIGAMPTDPDSMRALYSFVSSGYPALPTPRVMSESEQREEEEMFFLEGA